MSTHDDQQIEGMDIEDDEKIAKLVETNNRLNRRCQAAESALNEVVKVKKPSGSYGRALLSWYASKLKEENTKLSTLVMELAARGADGLWYLHRDGMFHCRFCDYVDWQDAHSPSCLWDRAQPFKEAK